MPFQKRSAISTRKNASKSRNNGDDLYARSVASTNDALELISSRFENAFPTVDFNEEETSETKSAFMDYAGDVKVRDNGRYNLTEKDELFRQATAANLRAKDAEMAARLADEDVIGKDVVEPRKRYDVVVKMNTRFIVSAIRNLSADADVNIYCENGVNYAEFYGVWQMTDTVDGKARIKFPETGEVVAFPYESVISDFEYYVTYGTIVEVNLAITGGDTYREWVVDTGKVNDEGMPVQVRMDSRKYQTSKVPNNATKVVL